ncbi:MAG TPA: hypothetical protein VFZ00_29205 [Solirubrobacter sp.]|nr:hypothetical protein [Solirubrobacter sp.]
MPTKSQPLRGEAAWRASVREIAERNEAARAVAMRQRALKEAAAARENERLERIEARSLPKQPHPR